MILLSQYGDGSWVLNHIVVLDGLIHVEEHHRILPLIADPALFLVAEVPIPLSLAVEEFSLLRLLTEEKLGVAQDPRKDDRLLVNR